MLRDVLVPGNTETAQLALVTRGNNHRLNIALSVRERFRLILALFGSGLTVSRGSLEVIDSGFLKPLARKHPSMVAVFEVAR